MVSRIVVITEGKIAARAGFQANTIGDRPLDQCRIIGGTLGMPNPRHCKGIQGLRNTLESGHFARVNGARQTGS